jgi:pimeloyl-ACP methyl ester carboxylesterase
VILVGNSMGGMISMIAATEHPDRVAGAVLVDPALPAWPDAVDPLVGQMFFAYHTPGVGEMYLAQWAQMLGPEGAVDQMLLLCFADPSRLTPQMRQAHVDLQVELAAHQDQEIADFLAASRSLTALLMDIDRWRDVVARIQAPTLLIAGDRDRLVPLVAVTTMAELRPDWALHVMEGVGHTPMMEDPPGFATAVFAWLDGTGKAAVRAAEHEEMLRPIA